ncbi:MAG: hypothetical protein IK000_00090 [Bacteroidaceae bacterium]|nr:hypothetical protein [Bacteroidaceae bacterium]
MKRTFIFFACVLTSITMLAEDDLLLDYLPFVEFPKQFNVVVTDANPNYVCSFESYSMFEQVEHNGRTYIHTDLTNDILCTTEDIGLFREEERRVYKYDETSGRDIMLYDFSLKEGDTFTYEYGLDQPVNCKVLKQGWLDDGPKVKCSNTSGTGTSDAGYRPLRTWTIGCENSPGAGYQEVATWVECVGAVGNMFSSFSDDGTKSYLAYVERRGSQADYWENEYLPFSLYKIFDAFGQIHGCDLPIGVEDYPDDGHHQLTYELEGDRLHIYGKVFTQCGPNNYAFFHERETDDPMTHKIFFWIQEAAPLADCVGLHATDIYVPGFDPNLNYIVEDNQGEEHPVINKTSQPAYRPFVEEGKVWKVGDYSGNPVRRVEYFYFDGDTIIDGKNCKQMMCQRFVSPEHPDYSVFSQFPSQSYMGAWYEEDKKVYKYDPTNKEFQLMYDFSLDANDTLWIKNASLPYIVGPRRTGGLKGFKGVYREVMQSYNENPFYNTTWLEGVGSIDGPILNVYYGEEAHAVFLMSCSVEDEVIYLNDEVVDGATPEIMDAQNRRIDFTHTIKTKPKAPAMRGLGDEEESLYGEYNELQLGINLDPLVDAYLVRITDETGNVVYEKAIDAAGIVGLNIDISTYEKGLYTVMVENDQESFTGVFEVQTTGIASPEFSPEGKDFSSLLQEGTAIYNLQGQRMSSLRKGLNIVNGRKVYVK